MQVNNSEEQYLSLVRNILDHGELKTGRNGDTLEIFGVMLNFDISNGKLPLLTTKYVNFQSILKELLWFVRGQTNSNILKVQGVNIWNDNSTRSFLDGRNLSYPEGVLGPIYGWQWRNFNGAYSSDVDVFSIENRIDQLRDIILQLRDPSLKYSRRLVMSAWNPCQLDQMALPPCHIMCQFNVSSNDELSCLMTQRSADVGLGLPYNIASYSILTHLIAHITGLKPGKLSISIGSAHIYTDHIKSLELQLQRTIYDLPTLEISSFKENIEDYNIEDFIITNYQHHPSIRMKMIA